MSEKSPFAYSGLVRKVVFEGDPHVEDDEHALHAAAQQASTVRAVDA